MKASDALFEQLWTLWLSIAIVSFLRLDNHLKNTPTCDYLLAYFLKVTAIYLKENELFNSLSL